MALQQPVLALDVGGTKLAAGVVSPDGTVQSFSQIATAVGEGPAAVVKRLLDLGEHALAESGLVSVAGAQRTAGRRHARIRSA